MHPYHGVDQFAAGPTPIELVHESSTAATGAVSNDLGLLLPIPVSGTMSGDGTPTVQSVPLASNISMPAYSMTNFATNSFMFPSPSVPTSGGGFTFTPLTTSHMPFQFPSPAYRGSFPVSGSSALPQSSSWQYQDTTDSMSGMSWQPDICHVTNSSYTTYPKPCSFVKPARMRCFKRRANVMPDEMPRAKLHINEEKMTACMQQLHLDNNNLDWHPDREDSMWHPDREDRMPRRRARTLQEIESRLIEEDEDEEPESDMMATTYNGLQRLELSKALKLGLHTKEILPKAVLDDLQRPCMQLVLWRPPGDMICNVVKEVTKRPSRSGGIDIEVTDKFTGRKMTAMVPNTRPGATPSDVFKWGPASVASEQVASSSPPVAPHNISLPLQIYDIDDDDMEL